MEKHSLTVQPRDIVGRKVKRLRAEGNLPANIFGKDIQSRAVMLSRSDFLKVFAEAGETGIVELALDKEIVPVLISNVQTHPVTGEPLHADFRQVNMKEKIEAQVPIELVGEAPAEKQGLGIIVQQTDEVTVEALPMDLPDNFEVDISKLEELGASITVADLPSSEKVKILDEEEKVIVRVEEIQEEEPEPVATETEGEAAEGEGAATETPAEESEASEE